MLGFDFRKVVLPALLFAFALHGACRSSDLVKGRCDKPSDCAAGLTCDNHRTCVPATAGTSPCSNDDQCGTDYICDNRQWCVCQVPNQDLGSNADPCSNGTLPPYRGVLMDGGADGDGSAGDGGGDGGDGGAGCQGPSDCSGGKPICAPSGACVECTSDVNCKATTKPICDKANNTCVRCTTDAQCVAKVGADPGVCLFHQDGRCATTEEVVYVKSGAGCLSSATPGGGTSTTPFCQIAQAVASADTRKLFVLRGSLTGANVTVQGSAAPLSFIGQAATLTADVGQSGFHVTGTDVYVRNVKIGTLGAATVGIIADGNATIRLDSVEVDNMPQGGLRVTAGAGYEIVNSIFAGNGGTRDEGNRFIGGVWIDQPPSGSPARFAFNTVVANKRDGVTCSNPAQLVEASLLAGNFSGVADYSTCTLDTTSKALGAADPMLTSTYRLTAASPCIDFVPKTQLNAPDHDIDGVARPQRQGFDCGASEIP